MLETSVDDDLVVRVKVNSTLRVERSEKFETAVARSWVVCLRVEKMATSRLREPASDNSHA